MSSYSVIITTHCRPPLLERALRSVRRQNFENLSVIVVADERSRETRDAARRHLGPADIFVARGGAPGPAASRNIGLSVATSDYVLFLDDDDELSDGMIPALDTAVDGAKDRVFFCDFWYVPDGQDRAAETGIAPAAARIGDRDVQELHVKNFIPNSCLIYPAATVRRKRFDEALGLNEDWDFLLNVMRDSALAYVPVFGPVIHQSPAEQGDRRGVQNEYLILEIMPAIYRKWPAPTPALRAARQALFATCGVTLPLDAL